MIHQTEDLQTTKSVKEWFDEYRQSESIEAKEFILDFFSNNTKEFLRELSRYEMQESILYLVQWEGASAYLDEDYRYKNLIQTAAKMNLTEQEREVLQTIENGMSGLAEANQAAESERQYGTEEVIQLFHDYNTKPSEEIQNEMMCMFEQDPVLFLDSLSTIEYQEQILQAVSWKIYHTGREGYGRYHDILEYLHQEKLAEETSEMLNILEKNIDDVERHEGGIE